MEYRAVTFKHVLIAVAVIAVLYLLGVVYEDHVLLGHVVDFISQAHS